MLINFLKNEDGAVLPLAALLLPILVTVGGLGVDTSSWMMNRRDLQTAADSAALAAAWEAARGASDEIIEYAALKEAMKNGYEPTQNGILEVVYDEEAESVSVALSQETELYFTKMIMDGQVTTAVQSFANVVEGEVDYCILSLDQVAAGSTTTSGAVDLSMPDCGIAVNSVDDEAMQLNGNVTIDVEDVAIVGNYDLNGGSAQFTYDNLETGVPETPNPYEGTEEPSASACNYNNRNISGAGTHTLSPGVYCGGLKISGNNTIVFEPGVYIIKGGDLDISGGGSLTGVHVAFYLTNAGSNFAQLEITGSKTITFSAPEPGNTLAGFVFYQDPDAPDSNSGNNLTGTANIQIDGVMYFPSQELNFGGNTTVESDICTKIVAKQVILHGTPYLGNSCDDNDAAPITRPRAKLASG